LYILLWHASYLQVKEKKSFFSWSKKVIISNNCDMTSWYMWCIISGRLVSATNGVNVIYRPPYIPWYNYIKINYCFGNFSLKISFVGQEIIFFLISFSVQLPLVLSILLSLCWRHKDLTKSHEGSRLGDLYFSVTFSLVCKFLNNKPSRNICDHHK